MEAIQDGVLGAIETYYNKASEKNQYDTTIDAVIVDATKKPQGIYTVRTTGAEFEAYATSGSYYKNDSVLVQIPNGDYKNQKFILGRKTDEAVANQTFNFKLPFEDFIALKYLNKDEVSPSGAYWANYPTFYTEDKNPVWHWENTGGSTIGNTRLGIEADWQTMLGMYQPLRGTYGFRVVIKGVTSSSEVNASTEIEREEYFTNRDMYGNTYAFYSPYTQQKVFDITEFLNIHSIDIYFYQDYNFADGNNTTIRYEYVDEEGNSTNAENGVPDTPENILFDNINIYLGISSENIKDETTFLYSYDALSYTGIETTLTNEDGVSSTVWSCDSDHDLHFVWVHCQQKETTEVFVIDNLEELEKQAKTSGKDTHIYWYRYNYGEEIKDTQESLFPGQLYYTEGDKYYPLLDEETDKPLFEEGERYQEYRDLYLDLLDSADNPDYQTKIERYGGSGWTFIPAATDSFVWNVKPRGEKSREKFKVVVQHHGTHTASEVLVLNNTRDVEAESAANAKNDAIVIKCFKLVKERDEETNEWTGKWTAKEDGSINAFHVYDENNAILKNDDDVRFDENYYYLQIHVRNEDTNEYELLTTVVENGLTSGTSVAWAFPRTYTMINTTEEVTVADAEYFDIASTDLIEYQNFHNATMKFKIKSIYNNRYLDNTVGALVSRNGTQHHIEKELMFGRAEGLGHEFLPVLEIIYPAGGSYICQGEEFQLGCTVYNKDGTLFDAPNTLTFNWKDISPAWESEDGLSKYFHYDSEGEIQDGYIVGEYYYENESDIDASFLNKYKGYKNNVIRGHLRSTCPYPPIFEVTVYGAADYPLTIRKGLMICNNPDYKQPRDFMIPSRVEFKSDGSAPLYYNDWFEVAKLTSDATALTATYDIEYPEWKINSDALFHLETRTVKRSIIGEKTDADGNTVTGEIEKNYTQYALKSNATYTDISTGKEVDTLQWRDELIRPAYYTYIYYNIDLDGDGNSDIYVAQALAYDRNLYSSSLVNDWDGVSLTWDEENGAILSTMIAAGTKDSDNKFTGVMMGDWSAKGDESLDAPGMYGYNKGAQTFGFKTDGTGFIGRSGRGRIQFDGNEAIISNADRSCYINLNPMHLDVGLSRAENQSFSENFIYCRVPKTENEFTSLTDGVMGPNSWVREYFEDKNNDYFIVDPNYGVLTTGGIIAKYGALGNWMISNEGMYQKSIDAYMYLGFDELDVNSSSQWSKDKVQVSAALRTLTKLYTQLGEDQENIDAAQALIDQKKALKETETERYNGLIADAEEAIDTIEKQIDDTEALIAAEEQKIADTKEALAQEQETWQANIQEVGNLETQIDTKQARIYELNVLISDEEGELGAQLADVNTKITTVGNFETSLEEYNIDLSLYKETYDELIEEETDILNRLESVNSAIDEATSEQNTKREALEAQQTVVSNINEEIRNKEIVVLTSETTVLNNLRTYYNDSAISEVKTITELETELSRLETEETTLNNEKTLLTEEKTSLTTEKTTVESRIIEINNLLADESTENENKNALQRELSEKQNRLAEINTRLTEINTRLTEIEELLIDNEDDQETIANLILNTQSLNTLYTELAALEETLATEQSELDDATTAYNNVTTRLSTLETTKASIQNEQSANQRSFNSLVSDLSALETNFDSINTSIKEYEDPAVDYIENIVNDEENIKERILNHFIELNNIYALEEDRTTDGKYQNLSTRITNILESLNSQRDTINSQLENNETIQGYMTEITTLEGEIDELEESIYQYKKVTIPANKAAIKSYNGDIVTSEYQISIYNTTINDYNQQIQSQQNLISGYNNAIAALDTAITSAEVTKTVAEKEKEDTQKSIDEQIEALDPIQERVEKEEDVDYTSQEITQENYTTVLNNLIDLITTIIFKYSTRYAIYVADQEPNYNVTSQVLPYFSVNWNGTMFARKGLIANTWTIDDYSLTYQKNRDIIYIGTEESSLPNDTYTPYGRADTLTDTRRWAISASDDYDENNPTNPYLINFGVSLSGELYAQLGTIGGWKITNNTLESIPETEGGNHIIFDSKNNIIKFSNEAFSINGNTGTVNLGQAYGSDGTVIGNVYLGEYLLSGRTVTETLAYTDSVLGNETSKDNTIGGINDNYGWGNVSVGGTTITSHSNSLVTNLNFSLSSTDTNYLQFLDAGHSNIGVVIASGARTDDGSKKATIMYPVQDGAILGLSGHRWNIVAKNIAAGLINADAVNGTKMYMNMKLLATQEWVSDQLDKIWDALAGVSGKAAAASSTSWRESIIDGDWAGTSVAAGVASLVFSLYKKSGIRIASNAPMGVAAVTHSHDALFQCTSGGSVSINVSPVAGGGNRNTQGSSIQHGHDMEGAFSDGTFSVSIGAATFGNASTRTYTYDVRSSSWFKSEIQKAIDAVASSVRSAFGSLTISVNGSVSCRAGRGARSGTARASASADAYFQKSCSGSHYTGASWTIAVSGKGDWSGSDSDSWRCTASHSVGGSYVTKQ